jgi:hypothetical protein
MASNRSGKLKLFRQDLNQVTRSPYQKLWRRLQQIRPMDYTLVIVCNGLIDFVYEAAKSVVLSWPIKNRKKGVTLGTSKKEIDRKLEHDSTPLNILGNAPRCYMFKGGHIPSKLIRRYPLQCESLLCRKWFTFATRKCELRCQPQLTIWQRLKRGDAVESGFCRDNRVFTQVD